MERFKTLIIGNKRNEITIDPADDETDLMIYIFDTVDETEICMFLKPAEAQELVNVLLEAIKGEQK